MDLNMKYELNRQMESARSYDRIIEMSKRFGAEQAATLFIWLFENILSNKNTEWHDMFCYEIANWANDKIKIIELQK